MIHQPNQLSSKCRTPYVKTIATLLVLIAFIGLQSCKDHGGHGDKGKSKTLFYTVGMTTDQFLKLIETKDFQSINFQYQNAKQDTGGNFQFDILGYAWKKEETKAGEFFESEFARPVPERKNYDFVPPYRFANLELWKDTIETFFKKLDSLGTPIRQFDSILLIPFKDKNSYASLYVVPIKKGEDVDADHLPVIKAEGQQQKNLAAPLAPAERYMKVLPCPPDCPHRADGTAAARGMAMDEVKHVH